MIYILIIPIVAIGDILVKRHIEKHYRNNRSTYICRKSIIIHKLHNRGGFLNFLESSTGLLKLLSGFTLLITGIIFGSLLPKKGCRLKKTGLALIIGGAASNEYDRYIKGSVTDYISFNLPVIKNIAFNMGDFAIFIGTALALFTEGKQSSDNIP